MSALVSIGYLGKASSRRRSLGGSGGTDKAACTGKSFRTNAEASVLFQQDGDYFQLLKGRERPAPSRHSGQLNPTKNQREKNKAGSPEATRQFSHSTVSYATLRTALLCAFSAPKMSPRWPTPFTPNVASAYEPMAGNNRPIS